MIYNYESGVKIGIYKFNEFMFENWSKNREPDEVRVDEISKWILENNISVMHGMIYAWKHPRISNLIIYDGIHRLYAIKKTDKSIDCVLHITETEDENVIIHNFININKSISVPYIYTEMEELKKMKCESILRILCTKYKDFLSSSRRCKKPNFNRDALIEFIADLNINFKKDNLEYLLIHTLDELNQSLYSKIQKYGFYETTKEKKCPEKCVKHHFYLFYLEPYELKQKLEFILN